MDCFFLLKWCGTPLSMPCCMQFNVITDSVITGIFLENLPCYFKIWLRLFFREPLKPAFSEPAKIKWKKREYDEEEWTPPSGQGNENEAGGKYPVSLTVTVCVFLVVSLLTHQGLIMQICQWTGWFRVVSGKDLMPFWHWGITWTTDNLLSIGPSGTNFNEILLEIQKHDCRKYLRPFNPGAYELTSIMVMPHTGWKTSFFFYRTLGEWES